MKFGREQLLLYAVTDRAWTGAQTLYAQAESALRGGATCLQLREKDLDMDAFADEAVQIRALCRRYGVPFIVNDSVEIALRCGADGIHVGQRDMPPDEVRARVGPDCIVGVSAQTVEQALRAERLGADYLGVARGFPPPPSATRRPYRARRCGKSARRYPSRCAPSEGSRWKTRPPLPARESPGSRSCPRSLPRRTWRPQPALCAALRKR